MREEDYNNYQDWKPTKNSQKVLMWNKSVIV